MKNGLQKIIDLIEKSTEKLGLLASWCTLILVVLVFGGVLARYFFKFSPAWIGELQWHIFAAIFMIGAAYTLKHDKHVRVDLFYSRFNKKDKAEVDFYGGIIFLIPFCLALIYFGSKYAYAAWEIGETSDESNGLSYRWLVKGLIPFSGLILLLQASVEVAKSWKLMRLPKDQSE